jgi:hypothetical protein
MMTPHLIRYRTTPEMAEENARLIEGTFKALSETPLPGVRYLAFDLGEGQFVHIVHTEPGADGLPTLEAFQAFLGGIDQRCVEKPARAEARIIGDYRMLGV